MTRVETNHLVSGSELVELISTIPDQPIKGCLLLVHGHQGGARVGAHAAMSGQTADHLAGNGWIASAVSQPGYGASTGPPDYCGPRTQNAITTAYSYLLENGADPDQTIVWGVSRGAIATACAFGSFLASPTLIVLQSGIYDMNAWVKWVEENAPGGDEVLTKNILSNVYYEAGTNAAALYERSGVNFVQDSCSDVLLVHGRQDDRAPIAQAEKMRDALASSGRRVRLEVETEAGHFLPRGLAMKSARAFRPELEIP
ncbi:alpha/beta hydrolase family protein [Roseibium sp.]|uniref:alpha/beta hydrolase family protein n=1 Tax=Roseibium sp. TaxID=1936156 RepID=UPI003D117DD3